MNVCFDNNSLIVELLNLNIFFYMLILYIKKKKVFFVCLETGIVIADFLIIF